MAEKLPTVEEFVQKVLIEGFAPECLKERLFPVLLVCGQGDDFPLRFKPVVLSTGTNNVLSIRDLLEKIVQNIRPGKTKQEIVRPTKKKGLSSGPTE